MDEEQTRPFSPTPRELQQRGESCPACGTTAAPGQRFCGQCGAPLSRLCGACGGSNLPHHRFCGACGAPLEALQATAAPPEAPAVPPPEERRWATALFADLSGFTAMAERMDPEDVKAFAHRCAEQLGEQVQRFGGTVIHVAGDEVAAVFGAPAAHEDDAERAVRAALAMRDSSLSVDPERPIRVHIGINTGEVMAGLVGPRSRREYTVMGDTVNTASRLASAALPGSVLVGEETYRATQRAVQYRALTPVEAKGKEHPIPAWEALDVAALPETRPLGTASLVGRDAELALLAGIWTRVAREAQPHLVTVLGEPGIGKSRVVAEFEQRLLQEARVLHGRCLPYGEALGYWALAMALKEAAGIAAEDDADTARARLGELVADVVGTPEREEDPEEVARHLAMITGLDIAADRAAAAADQRTLFASLRRFLEALARRQPLCVMVEDIHWADAALLDLIEFVASRVHEAPLLILAQARPELLEKRPSWGRGVRAFTSLPLQPLDQRARQSLALALCRERGLSPDAVDQVGSGSGGNPLFAEELVATLAERGGAAGVPSMIKALISARLDTLPLEERRTLQLAGVFGKLFWEGGLLALGASRVGAQQLEALVTKDLLRAQPRSQFRGEREYAFKHDLIRDVAYETLPRAERRALHGRAAEWIEQAAGDQAEEYLAVLAHHTVQAEQEERALDYLMQGAARAGRAAAYREEAALLAQATAIAARRGQPERVAELRARRGTALHQAGLWADARPDLEAALAAGVPEPTQQGIRMRIDLAVACHWLYDVPSTRRYAAEALALAEEAGREELAAGAMGALALADSSDGELHASLDRYERAFARAGEGHAALLAPGLEQSGLILYWLARADEAIARSRQAIQFARTANDTLTTIRALGNLGLALAASGRYDEAVAVFEEASRFGREYGISAGLARALSMYGGMHLELGDFAGAEALAEEAREIGRSINWQHPVISGGIDLLVTFARHQEVGRADALLDEVAEGVRTGAGAHGWLWRLRFAQARAETALARGDGEAALRWAEDAIAQSRLRTRVKYEVAGLATRGQALACLGRQREAIAGLRSAVELARPVGDPVMFLRAATALLAIDGEDALAAEAHHAAQRVAATLPEALRCRFEAAEPVRRLAR